MDDLLAEKLGLRRNAVWSLAGALAGTGAGLDVGSHPRLDLSITMTRQKTSAELLQCTHVSWTFSYQSTIVLTHQDRLQSTIELVSKLKQFASSLQELGNLAASIVKISNNTTQIENRTPITPVAMSLAGGKSRTKLEVAVDRPTPYTFDLGLLLTNDANPITTSTPAESTSLGVDPLEAQLIATARDGAQALISTPAHSPTSLISPSPKKKPNQLTTSPSLTKKKQINS